MRRRLTGQLNNCFMCNNPFDHKPLIEEDEKSGSPESDFKRGFSLFCKILNDVHSCDSELLTKFAESYENAEIAKEVDLVMGARGKSGVFESPCCSLCCDTLVTILGLQKAIEESQATQLDHVKNLKEVLKLSSDSADDIDNNDDFWNTIRRQLVACLTSATSFSDGDNDDKNDFPYLESSECSDNEECPIPTPTSSLYTSVSASKDPLDTNATLRKRKQRYDNRQENERTSFKPKIAKSTTVKPCSVHLEKIDLKKVTQIGEVRVNLPPYCKFNEEAGNKYLRRRAQQPRKLVDYKEPSSWDSSVSIRSTSADLIKTEDEVEENEDENLSRDGDEDDDAFGLFNEPLSVDRVGTVGSDYCKMEKNLNLKSKIKNVARAANKSKTDVRRSRCNEFHTVGKRHLLFQHTFVRYSSLGFQCLEGGTCLHTVSGTNYYSLQEIRYHILDDHDGLLYSRIPRTCIVCKQKYPNGVLLRRHLFSKHAELIKLICESCWKPFPPIGPKHSLSAFQSHTSSHKCIKEKVVDKKVENFIKQYGTKIYNKKMQVLRKRVKNSGRKLTPRRMLAVKLLKSWDVIMTHEQSDTISEDAKAYFPQERENGFEGITQSEDKRTSKLKAVAKSKKLMANVTEKEEDRDSEDFSRKRDNDDEFKPFDEPVSAEDDDSDYCEMKKNLKVKPKRANVERQPNKCKTGFKPLPVLRRSRCNGFYTVGKKHLLFQHTFIGYSPLGFQCLEEGNCFHTVSGTNYYSLQEIRYHILDDHDGPDYPKITKTCVVCKQENPNGVQLRNHLISKHSEFIKQICESCWKPFPVLCNKYTVSEFKCHSCTHKSNEDKANDIEVEKLVKKHGLKEYKRRMQGLRRMVGNLGRKLTPKRLLDVTLLRKQEVLKDDSEDVSEDATEVIFPKHYEDSDFEGITPEGPNHVKEAEDYGRLSFFLNCQRLVIKRQITATQNLSPSAQPYRTSCLFWLVGEELLLFQNTTIHFSHNEFKCLEKNCGRIVKRGEDSEFSFTEIGNHVNEDHKSHLDYGSISRNCPICQEKLKDGYSLRLHLFHDHFCPSICVICWKPMHPNNTNFAAIHMWTHKSVQERNAVIEAGGKDLDPFTAKGTVRYKRVTKKGRVKISKNLNTRKSRPKKRRKVKIARETEDDNPPQPEDFGLERIPKLGIRQSKQKAFSVIRKSLQEISGSEGEDIEKDVEELSKKKNDDGEFEPASGTSTDEEDEVDNEMNDECNGKSDKSEDEIAIDTKRRKLSRCDGFHIVGQDHLLFQHTFIKYSPLGFQCLEGTCGKEVGGTDFNAFQEIRLHIMVSHFGSLYALTPKSCIVCQKEFPNGTLLRRHLRDKYTSHNYKQICETCWKPFPALNTRSYYPKIFKDHTLTHKSEEDIAADNEVSEQKRLIGVKGYNRRLISLKKGKSKRVYQKTGNGKTILQKSQLNIYVLKDDFLLYLFTLIKLSNGEIQCQEENCDKKVGSFEPNAIHQMKAHINLCHQDRNGSRSCKMCGEKFQNGIDFRRHQTRYHSISPSTLLCEICLKPVKNGDSRVGQFHIIHTMSHLNDKELQAAFGNKKNKDSFLEKIQAAKMGQEVEYMEGGFKCQLCDKEFSCEYHLTSHIVTHQPASMRKQFECSYCQIKLLSRVALRSHIERQHRPDLQKKFRDCPICNRRFHYRDGERFRTHMRAHNNETPFVCELCGKGFFSKDEMKRHVETHKDTNDFQCEYCEKNYKNVKNLRRHKRIAHKEMSG